MKNHDGTCAGCDKPLGNSADGRCHDCGGATYRGGTRITNTNWLVLLGAV